VTAAKPERNGCMKAMKTMWLPMSH